MKTTKLGAMILGLFILAAGALLGARATKVYFEDGGAKLVVESGGEIELQSGATLDMQSGATIGATAATVTTLTATTVNAATIAGTTLVLDAGGGADEATLAAGSSTFVGAVKLTGAAAPPAVCAAGTAGTLYYDSDINKLCVCNATAYVLADDSSTTTGCS